MKTETIKELVKAALHDAEVYSDVGSGNREITRCSGCNQIADGWGCGAYIEHTDDCPYPKKVHAIAELQKWAETPTLNTYHSTFSGHWLRGDAIVVAESPKVAADMLNLHLVSVGLLQRRTTDKPVEAKNIRLLDLTKPCLEIIDDGNY